MRLSLEFVVFVFLVLVSVAGVWGSWLGLGVGEVFLGGIAALVLYFAGKVPPGSPPSRPSFGLADSIDLLVRPASLAKGFWEGVRVFKSSPRQVISDDDNHQKAA